MRSGAATPRGGVGGTSLPPLSARDSSRNGGARKVEETPARPQAIARSGAALGGSGSTQRTEDSSSRRSLSARPLQRNDGLESKTPRQIRPSGIMQPKEKIVPRVPPAIRILQLLDGDTDMVLLQLQNRRSRVCTDDFREATSGGIQESSLFASAQLLLLDVCDEAALEDYLRQFGLQYCLLDHQTSDGGSIETWRHIEADIVELRGRQLLALLLPVCSLVEVRLRQVQRQVPDSLAAWTDWSRNARKDAELWFSRALPPILVGLPAPSAPEASAEVDAADGTSLALRLRWSLTHEDRRLLGNPVHWQYRWRKIVLGSSGDNASDVSQWSDGPILQTPSSDPASGVEIFPLLDSWQHSTIVCCVRYRAGFDAIQCWSWSPWSAVSAPIKMSLPPPGPLSEHPAEVLRVIHYREDPTAAELSWTAFIPSDLGVKALQYRVEILEKLEGERGVSFEDIGTDAKKEAGESDEVSCDVDTGLSLCHDSVDSREVETGASWKLLRILEDRDPVRSYTSKARFSCTLWGLKPSFSYIARVLARHWRVDDKFAPAVSLSFKVPPTGAEDGIAPPRPLPDSLLPQKYQGEETRWFAFWLPAFVASWPDEATTVEWRIAPELQPYIIGSRAERKSAQDQPSAGEPTRNQTSMSTVDTTWHLAPSERFNLVGAQAKLPLEESGCGACAQLPGHIEELFVRYRHRCGLVSAASRVVTVFGAPEAPSAALEIEDDGLAVLLHVQGHGRSYRHVTRCELEVETCAEDDIVDPAIAPSTVLRVIQNAFYADFANVNVCLRAEDPGSPLRPGCRHRFRARLGDELRWSPWGPPTNPLLISVPVPQPAAASVLLVRELPERAVEVLWWSFQLLHGLQRLDYLVEAAPLAHPDDSLRQLLPCDLAEAAAAEASPDAVKAMTCREDSSASQNRPEGRLCRAVLRRFVPDTDYRVSVIALYARLERYCVQRNWDPDAPPAESGRLVTVFRTAGIDFPSVGLGGLGQGPPLPPLQRWPPAEKTYGDATVAGQAAAWCWDIWMEVDQRAVPDLRGSTPDAYVLEWRSHDEQADGPWLRASAISAWTRPWTAAKGSGEAAGCNCEDCAPRPPQVGHALCCFELTYELERAERWAGKPPPERVEFRLVMKDTARRLGVTPRLWLSRTSLPVVTAYSPPPKPRAAFQVKPGQLQISLSFCLSGLAPGVDTIPTDSVEHGVVLPGKNVSPSLDVPVPATYGHRYATHFQVRHRLAGDQHIGECKELRPKPLERQVAEVDPEALPSGWLMMSTTISVQHPEFSDGEKRVFSVRIGDTIRWSQWSAFSKPVAVKLPEIEAFSGGSAISLSATAELPDTVCFEWPALRTAMCVPVESTFWAVELGADERDTRDHRQVVAMHTEEPRVPAEQRHMRVSLAGVQLGRPYYFMILARHLTDILGPTSFRELGRTPPISWPRPEHTNHEAAESWDLPVPQLLPVADDIESRSARWRGWAALLAWPKGVVVSERPPLELQACAEDDDPVSGWGVVPWTLMRVEERPLIAASPLPCLHGRFRWFSRDRRVAGPRSDRFVAGFEVPEAPLVELICSPFQAFVRVRVFGHGVSHELATQGQLRFQQVQMRGDQHSDLADDRSPSCVAIGAWMTLGPMCLLSGKSDGGASPAEPARWLIADLRLPADNDLREGRSYIFSARVGDIRRMSSWSAASSRFLFGVPAPVPPQPREGEALLVEALEATAVRFHWPPLRSNIAVVSPRSLEPCSRPPRLECRLDVSLCLPNGGLERQRTVLLEDDPSGGGLGAPCEVVVEGLEPEARYFAAVAARFAHLGRGEWCKTGLTASFQMPAEEL